jgi:hypothetical protein
MKVWIVVYFGEDGIQRVAAFGREAKARVFLEKAKNVSLSIPSLEKARLFHTTV